VTRPVVFVVDDEEAVRKSLSRLLRTLGFDAEAFPSAESFLARYAGDDSACLLLDLRMPGMSGLDLIDELRRRQSTLSIIVMTGHTDIGSMQRLKTLDTFGFLEKPFPITDLKALLAKWREKRG